MEKVPMNLRTLLRSFEHYVVIDRVKPLVGRYDSARITRASAFGNEPRSAVEISYVVYLGVNRNASGMG